jgi:hypothetical protein
MVTQSLVNPFFIPLTASSVKFAVLIQFVQRHQRPLLLAPLTNQLSHPLKPLVGVVSNNP